MSQEQEKVIQELIGLTAHLMAKKTSRKKISLALMERGASESVATEIIRVVDNARREAKRKQGAEDMQRGFWILVGGLVITGITYGIASGSGGGTYIVASGAMLVGGLYVIQGFLKLF